MPIVYFELKIALPTVHSLKEKRGIISSLITRISKKFNVSIAELDYQDVWQSSKIGIAIVSNHPSSLDPTIQNIVNFISFNYPDIDYSIISKENL